MTSGQFGVALRQMHTLFNVGSFAGLTDGELLERFLTRRDEAAELAFAVLVERHGPMILRVCRRVLDRPHDVDDAFQATFLILVRRAGAIRKQESVGSWLHGVAFRVATCARAAAARRRLHERRGAAMLTLEPAERPELDLGPALHEEVGRLPDRFRAVVVLCDLEGLTYEQAARQLGWPVGTVKSRLARGRQRLRDRLVRRGLVPGTLALGAVLAAESASAAVPQALLDRTVRAAMRCAAGKAATAGAVSASVASLTEGVLKTMFLTKLKAGAMAVGLVAAGAGVWASTGGDDPPDTKAAPPARSDTQRLTELEQRLDTVLQSLGKADVPPGSPSSVNRTVQSLYGVQVPDGATWHELRQAGEQPALHNQGFAFGLWTEQPDGAGAHPQTFYAQALPPTWKFDLKGEGMTSPQAGQGSAPNAALNPETNRFLFVPQQLGNVARVDGQNAPEPKKPETRPARPTTEAEKLEQLHKALEQMVKLGPIRVMLEGDLEISVVVKDARRLEAALPIIDQMARQGSLRMTLNGPHGGQSVTQLWSHTANAPQTLSYWMTDRATRHATTQQAQANPATTRPAPEAGLSDRLNSVEQKLDRILKALSEQHSGAKTDSREAPRQQ